MSQITAKRYAAALYEAVGSLKNKDEINNQIVNLIELFKSELILGEVLHSPVVQPDDKKKLVVQIFEKKIDNLLVTFILFLISKRRINLSQNIFKEYLAIIDKKNGKMKSIVLSAIKLDDDQLNRIKKFLNKNFSNNIEIANHIDKSLFGGYQIKIGDLVIDQSLRNHMQKLKARLLTG